jgi:hypothetical protein
VAIASLEQAALEITEPIARQECPPLHYDILTATGGCA